jgi:hypothetical protein
MDADAVLAYKIPADDLKASENLAKKQLEVRDHLLKLQLPAAEAAKQLFDHTNPFESPAALKAALMAWFVPEEGADTRPEAEQFESCVHVIFTQLNISAALLSNRLTLESHVSLLYDYDMQLQRTALVSTQSKALKQEAFGREVAHTFSPHSSVLAQRIKVDTDWPKLTLENLTEALNNRKGLHKERKEKRSCTEKLRIEFIKTAMRKAEDLTVACPIFQFLVCSALLRLRQMQTAQVHGV